MGPEELLHHDQRLAKAPVSVPGDIIENIYIPARGYMKARKLERGDILRIIDLEGHQVPDVILFDADHLRDVSSCVHTCVVHQRWKIRKGDTIYSKYGKRMATIGEDTVGHLKLRVVTITIEGIAHSRGTCPRRGFNLTHHPVRRPACAALPYVGSPAPRRSSSSNRRS